MLFRIVVPLALVCAGMSPANGQGIPKLPGGASGLLGGAMPNLSSVGVPNAAGVLEYCLQNKLLGGTGASDVLGGLTKVPGTKSTPEYSAGAAGNIITGKGGAPFSLDSLPPDLKKQGCDLMLKQGTSLLH